MKITRRTAFKGLAAVGALPLFNIGCANFGMSRARQIAKGAKIRVALIGCGLQTKAMIDGVLCEDLVAIVDPDPERFRILDKFVAETCGAAERENYAKARRFATYQDMFDKMGGEIDAVVVETPNHQHVLPAVMAMRRGMHVYLDKPLCLTAAECDLILDEARKNPGLVTQCGTYGHSFPSMKYCVDRIAEGALGEVREVWAYDDRCNSIYQRPAAVPPPKGMDWDLWCGGSPVCDFYPDSPDQDGMHPHGWHSWIGYGNGSIGNLGMHIMDVAFWALGLKDPDTVTCHEAKFALDGAWAFRDAFEFHYPTSKFGYGVTMHWWDGLNDGVPYTKEYVNKYGMPYKREHLNIPPKVLEVEKANGFEKDPSTRTESSSSARRATSGSRTTAATASCRARTAGAFRASTGRTTSTTAWSRRSTSTSSTRRSAPASRRSTTSSTRFRSRRRSASATSPRSPGRGASSSGTDTTSRTT